MNLSRRARTTVYPKKYAHGFCFAVLCCGYTLTDFPISIRLTSLALWQSSDCPSASKATLMNMDKYFMWIHYERLHNHNKAKHNKTVCIFLGIYYNNILNFSSYIEMVVHKCSMQLPLADSCRVLVLLVICFTRLCLVYGDSLKTYKAIKLIYAGTITGQSYSVALKAIYCLMLYRQYPSDLKWIFIWLMLARN